MALVGACAAGADALLVPVLAYGACLGTMAVATGVNRLTAVGGAVFIVSVPAFGLPAQGFGVMATYVVAQALLVAGVLNEPPGASPTATPTDAVRAR